MTTRPKATAVPGVKTTAVKMFWSLYNVIDSSFNMTVILQQTQVTDIHDWYIQISDKEPPVQMPQHALFVPLKHVHSDTET